MSNNRHRRATARNAYIYLANNGPTPNTELPNHPKLSDKKAGVRSFNLRASYQGSSVQGGGNKTSVCYIEGKHDPESVVSVWFDTNSETVERVSTWALHQRAPERFRPAIRAQAEFDREWGDGGDGSTNEPCPFCGDNNIKSIPVHLPNCEERP